MQDMRSERDRRSRVALGGFRNDLRLRHVGQLPDNLVADEIVGQNPDTLGRNQRLQPLHRFLNQRPFARDVQNLFGVPLAAARPETRSAPAGEYQA